ncbi:MAG: hypothetical protein NW226_18430 [Microscillaceae bacterium]|nr:hypothetical protein [Microscillaceae bacterium]
MFSFFKKNKKPQIPTEVMVWMTWEAKYQGLVSDINNYLSSGTPLGLVAFFSRTLFELEEILKSQKVSFHRLDRVSERASTEKIPLVQANLLDEFVNQSRNPFGDRSPAVFLIAEQYPIYSPEARLLENLAMLTPQAKAYIYTDLESPLMKAFGVEQLVSLMERLGMKPNDCIKHAFVNKSISNAQKKLEAKVESEINTDSMQAWFSKNIRS